ncbi:MAG TPA: metal-dependent hydrolase [Blastocatellia bacterium]|nr:metal-dependent hydrolase [Blastocatellia bacterium]
MPLPIAHACIGAGVATAIGPPSSDKNYSKLQLAAALLAVVPDLDFIFVWVLNWGPGWHRAFAHSIAFAAIVAFLAAFAFRTEWKRAALVLWAAMSSHALVDLLTSRLAPGAELFWPFYSGRYSAGFVDYLDFSIRVRGHLEFLFLIIKISLVEAIVFIPLLLTIRLLMNKLKTQGACEPVIDHQEIG